MTARKTRVLSAKSLAPGESPDVSFVPPIQRRRLSPLQKIFFHLARMESAPAPANVVFASRDGEDALTRRTVADFAADGGVSPQRFSASVYNAAPGMWSVFAKNTAPYTAIAAGDDTVRLAFAEALAMDEGPVLVVCAEETEGGHGFSVLFDFCD